MKAALGKAGYAEAWRQNVNASIWKQFSPVGSLHEANKQQRGLERVGSSPKSKSEIFI